MSRESEHQDGDASLAQRYESTRDLSEFEGGETVPVEVRRNVTISVRFSDEEIALLRARAAELGVKVTAYIRAAALHDAVPVDRGEVLGLLDEVWTDLARVRQLLHG